MKLIIEWNNFEKQINELIKEAKSIWSNENTIQTEEEFEKMKIQIKDWSDRSTEFLKKSFDEEQNEFATSFYRTKSNRFIIGNQKKDFRQIKKEAFEDFNSKVTALIYYKRILGVSDAIIKPKIVELNNRELYTTEQILELILEKLFDLYDNNYNSISVILEGNGIIQKRHGEDREYLKMLENLGYVTVQYMRDPMAQLTMKGKMYIEDKRKTYNEDYNDINKSQEEINSRVDEIIDKLTKLGYGQEIIFNEIDELKELYTKLNTKTWGQVVKGKIVDLALSKLVENDTLSYIYEKLTDHQLRLP